jgi:hypothetical protein
MLDEEELAALRRKFRTGRRVRLLALGERERSSVLRPGAEGTVWRVDDAGTVHVDWDVGVTLGCIVVALNRYERADRLQPL